MDQDAFHQALNDLAHLPRRLVEQIVSSVPREWDVNPDARKALTEFIVQRALFLTGHRTGIMGIHLYQRALDLPAKREDKS